MAQFKEITQLEEWKECLERSADNAVCIFKHSTTCPISAEAYREFTRYLSESPREDIEYVLVKVIESRPVSNQIASDLTVKHESPQAILVADKKAKWNASHWKITNKNLQVALSE